MAVKKKVRAKKRRRETTAELSARLAPLEEIQAVHATDNSQNNGAMVVKRDSFKLPEGLAQEEAEKVKWLGLDPVVFILLIIALSFIGFITYLISKMPDTPTP